MEGQPAPASEPSKPTQVVEPSTKGKAAAEAAGEVDVSGAKAKATEEDATPAREVSDRRSRKVKSFFFPVL